MSTKAGDRKRLLANETSFPLYVPMVVIKREIFEGHSETPSFEDANEFRVSQEKGNKTLFVSHKWFGDVPDEKNQMWMHLSTYVQDSRFDFFGLIFCVCLRGEES